jgi:hypothetical protein
MDHAIHAVKWGCTGFAGEVYQVVGRLRDRYDRLIVGSHRCRRAGLSGWYQAERRDVREMTGLDAA